VDPEQLRRALIEHGFHEAAAMVAADVEAQALEEDEGGEVPFRGSPSLFRRAGGAARRDFDDAA